MPTSTRTPSLKGQVLSCLLFVAVAVATTVLLHPSPVFSHWRAGKSVELQLSVAVAFALLCALGGIVTLRIPALLRLIRTPEALQKINLSGTRPLIVGLCAGIGEEMLFRAALQPLGGLWLGAVIFAVAHIRTATLGSSSNAKRFAYLLNVAAVGVVLGLVFEHLGLIAAILIHATIDVVALMVLRSASARLAPRSAA